MVLTGVCGIQGAGCSQIVIRPLREHVPDPVPEPWDPVDWSQTLRENVRDGLVDYANLAAHREPLDRFLGLLSVVGPERTPAIFADPGDRAAYWINAYNAMMVRVVLELYPTSTVYDVALPDPEADFVFPIDGRQRSPWNVRQQLEQETGGDARVLFTLCGAAQACPPLEVEPFRGFDLDRRVAEAARVAIRNPKLVRIDHVQRRLLVWLELYSRRGQEVEDYEQRYQTRGATLLTVLNNWADPGQRSVLASARGYRIGPLPFDRRLNDVGTEAVDSSVAGVARTGEGG